MHNKLIAIVADQNSTAQEAYHHFISQYSFIDLDKAPDSKVDIIIVLGGDGFMLHSMHRYFSKNAAFYGLNCGTVGFLLNEYSSKTLLERISQANVTSIYPLSMKAININNEISQRFAINEVSLFRKSTQAAKIKIEVDSKVRIDELICDGVMVSTPAGSSAYNFSVGGPILPLGCNVLALTPISPFRPRRWKGALLPYNCTVKFDILEQDKRPVSAVADFYEFPDIISVEIFEDRSRQISLLFDPDHNLEERLIKEQFAF